MTTTGPVSRLFFILLISFCAVYLLISTLPFSGNTQKGGIACVSYTRALEGSSILEQENRRHEKIVTLAREALEKKQQKYYAMPAPLRRELREIDNITNNNLLRAEQSHERRISLQVISDAVEKYRVENHYSVVFNKDIAEYVPVGRDISEEIINHLQRVKVEYGELPTFDERALPHSH